MNRKKSYIVLFMLLCLTTISTSTVDIIDYTLHMPVVLMSTIIVYMAAFSLIQFKAKISIWEKIISSFLSPFVISVLYKPAWSVLNMIPGYANFYNHLPGDPAGPWLFLIILWLSWFVGALVLVFALLKIVLRFIKLALDKIKK